MALVKNYTEGDITSYSGNEYTVEAKLFKVNNIASTPKSIIVTLIDESGDTVACNFWLSSYGTDPNIYRTEVGQYKLVDIEVGDTIVAVGHYYNYNGQKQFRACGGYQVSNEELQYRPKFNEDCFRSLIGLMKLIKNEKLLSACHAALQEYQKDFTMKPAAHSHHHNYIGGLLQHTAEVMKFAYNIATAVDCDIDVVLTAAFFHDIEKVKEYTLEGDYLPYATQVGHVVGSALTFMSYARMLYVNEKDIDKVVHCILAHHGKKEWGSPVEPQTPEAAIVHEADMISSRLNPLYIKLREDLDKDYYMNW